MNTRYFFSLYINYFFTKNKINEKNMLYMFSDDPRDYKILSKEEIDIKIKKMNLTALCKGQNTKYIKNYLMNTIYVCNHKIVNPIYEIRLKFLKYRELESNETEVFFESQRLYQTLYRFINRIKINKMRKFDNEYDLCMIPFSSMPIKQSLWLFENNIRFQFNVRDLMNIVVSALSSSFFMFETAKMPKNPFTNKELTIHQLYMIYVRLRTLNIKIPLLYELFLKANFSLPKFRKENARLLTEYAINTHYRKDIVVTKERVIDVLEMIRDYCNPFMTIKFHKQFPIQTIYDIFRPYLLLRAKVVAFGCNSSAEMLRYGLKIFHLFNPMFGHKYIYNNGNIGFDYRHISYGELFNCKFYGEDMKSMAEIVIQNTSKYGSIYNFGVSPIDDVQYVLMKMPNDFFPNTVVEEDQVEGEQEDEEDQEEEDQEEEPNSDNDSDNIEEQFDDEEEDDYDP